MTMDASIPCQKGPISNLILKVNLVHLCLHVRQCLHVVVSLNYRVNYEKIVSFDGYIHFGHIHALDVWVFGGLCLHRLLLRHSPVLVCVILQAVCFLFFVSIISRLQKCCFPWHHPHFPCSSLPPCSRSPPATVSSPASALPSRLSRTLTGANLQRIPGTKNFRSEKQGVPNYH